MSVSCALWATSLHQWARRYIRLTQPARCSPEKRARMRAFFANGVENMHIQWAVEGLPMLLHLSLFLFFGGLIIFLFNVDHEVFICVVSWIGFFSVVYGLITLLPLLQQDSPYYSPLSIPVWFPYAGARYVTFKILASISSGSIRNYAAWLRYCDLRDRYRGWMFRGMEKTAEETASERSSKIDIDILGWTISALGDDDSLEKFFEAIAGFFDSKLVNDLRERLPVDISTRLLVALDGFLGRTLSSNLVIDSVKLHRLDLSLSAMSLIRISGVSSILKDILYNRWDQVPKTVGIWPTLGRWCSSNDQLSAQYAQGIVAKVLATMRERDDRWVELAALVYGLPERDLKDYVSHGGDSVLLHILIHLTRNSFRLDLPSDLLEELTRFDIRNTFSGLQHGFCKLWNEIAQEAKKQGPIGPPVYFLRLIRHHYIALHQGTNAAPTMFSPSTDNFDAVLGEPVAYPLCDIASHHPDSIAYVPVPVPTQPAHSPGFSPHHFTSGGSNASPQVGEASIIAEQHPSPSHPAKPSEIREHPQGSTATLPAITVHTGPNPTEASLQATAAAALQDISQDTTLSHLLEEITQRDIVASCGELDITEDLSTASSLAPTPTPVLIPASTPPVLNKLLEAYDASAASSSDPLSPASPIVSFSIPTSSLPSGVPQLPSTVSLSPFSSTTYSRSTANAGRPRLRSRGLVNIGSMCFANAVLQLLVHSLPFWDLFRKLGDLKGQRRAEGLETGSVATPLVDTTWRFLDEFKESLPTQEPLQQATMRKPGEDEEATKEQHAADPFEPKYMYDAMKEKRQLKKLLVRFHAT